MLLYWMPDYERPGVTNGQYEVNVEMMNILELLEFDMLGGNVGTVPLLFRRIVERWHKFVVELSNDYCNLR